MCVQKRRKDRFNAFTSSFSCTAHNAFLLLRKPHVNNRLRTLWIHGSSSYSRLDLHAIKNIVIPSNLNGSDLENYSKPFVAYHFGESKSIGNFVSCNCNYWMNIYHKIFSIKLMFRVKFCEV